MDLEKVGSQNWLEIWRERKGLSSETVDKMLAVPSGSTEEYENWGIMRVPGYLLATSLRFMKSTLELHETLNAESARWRRQLS